MSHSRSRAAFVVRFVGILIAVGAIIFCVKTLAGQWDEVKDSIKNANLGWLTVALICSALAMAGLAVLWWGSLHLFGSPARVRNALAWYFGGELGKYVPGGVWQVLGRGELAQRGGGIGRGKAYATTLISYASMCIAAGMTCGVLAPILAADGQGLGWGWLMLAMVPLGLIVVHPIVMGPLLNLARRLTHGRIDLQPQGWAPMVRLILTSIPTWILVGAASVAVTESLGYHQQPARVAFAAVAAWIIGFLAVPIPAGAGLREVLFAGISGLEHAPAIAVAAIARLLLILVDGVGGGVGLWYTRRTLRPIPAVAFSTGPSPVEAGPTIAGGPHELR